MRIVLDAGHGGSDPGAVLYGRDGKTVMATERDENLKMVLTLKEVLLREYSGAQVDLTRKNRAIPGGGINTAPSLKTFQARTSGMGACDLYLSVHFDWSGAGRKNGGVYWSGDHLQQIRSSDLARKLAADFQGWCESDRQSNHGRLYIRDARTSCAVLWEVAPLQILDRGQRLSRARIVAAQIAAALGLAPLAGGDRRLS